MTILGTRALPRDAVEARAALIAVRARPGQDNELLLLPCLEFAGDAAIWRVCWDARMHVMCSHGPFLLRIRVARLLHVFCRQHQHQLQCL
jgi:hypothetical protein